VAVETKPYSEVADLMKERIAWVELGSGGVERLVRLGDSSDDLLQEFQDAVEVLGLDVRGGVLEQHSSLVEHEDPDFVSTREDRSCNPGREGVASRVFQDRRMCKADASQRQSHALRSRLLPFGSALG
jgi:hypothetical protein